MRKRHRGGFTTRPITEILTPCEGVPIINVFAGSSITFSGSKEDMVDSPTPGFGKLRSSGGIVMSRMTHEKESRTYNPGAASRVFQQTCIPGYWRSWASDACYDHTIGAPPYLEPDDYSGLATEVYTMALASVNQPDMMGLVDLAEARKTLVGLATSVKAYRKLLLGIHSHLTSIRGRAVSMSEAMRYIGSRWLEYRYQFLPILLSSRAAIAAYKNSPKPKGFRQTYRSQKISSSRDVYRGTTVENYGIVTELTAHRTCDVMVRAGVLTEVVRARSLAAELGLDFSQVGNAAWELVPFSFVADWFLNIGDLVSTVSPMVGRKALGSWTTVRIVQNVNWITKSRSNLDPSQWSFGGGSSSGTMSRTVTSRDPGGSVGFALRTFQWNKNDARHLADALALLNQALR